MVKALHQQDQLPWPEARADNKTGRRELTDVIASFIEYAKAQGSNNAGWYFKSFTTCVNNALFQTDIIDRDMLSRSGISGQPRITVSIGFEE